MKILKNISNRYFQLCNKDKAYNFYEIDEMLLKIQNGDKTDNKNPQEIQEICEVLSQKEKDAFDILKYYKTLAEKTSASEGFPWNGRIIDYSTLRQSLAEEIVVKEVRVKVFDQLGELFFCAILSDDDKATIYRSCMRFLEALTLCLYSDKVFAARACVEELGRMFEFDVDNLPELTDVCNGACLRKVLLPFLEQGYGIIFRKTYCLVEDEIRYLLTLKGAFAEIAKVVEQHYGSLDQVKEHGIHVPDCFFSYDLLD
ncbi:hypothetical protein [Sodalis sp. dw_96]|uniref:hypothetical protein n=1 Tax=Sodalis sp. dw_96 TaxID=2719794 RepID=UPI001BD1F2ED|nr:hypothetical protein [Sodalis sp. dw_96]